ncbi:hypothetical protein [Aureispira sp. CCB-QB1]|uniref:hypothetical protein n=1 Tax=Aureispira sp. CCB-QB1 TaxID=1313421 RepID=UPI0006960B08|nr:hypothetical protein [Aureispira sp. CCB-QB1]
MQHTFFIILAASLLVLSCGDHKPPKLDPDSNRGLKPFAYASIDIEPTKFTIDNSRDTLVFGANDFFIYVPAKAFIARGSNTMVDLYLKEYHSPSAALAQSISNASLDHHLLAASKVIYLEAKQGINTLSISPKHDLRIHFKKDKNTPEIGLWSGHPQAWTPIKFDQPRLFNHRLKTGQYKEAQFADGSSIELWEDKNLTIRKEKEEQELWDNEQHLHLDYTINKLGKIENVAFEEKVNTNFQKRILKVMKNYPICKPFLVNGQPTAVSGQYIFHVHQAEPHYKKDIHYINILGKKYPKLQTQKISHIDQLEFKYHIFNISKLGWIAAAKAIDSPDPVNLVVKVEPTFLAEVKLMLQKSKIILTGKREGNQVSFSDLPKNEAIQIIAFGEKDKQPVLASTKANSSDGVIEQLQFSSSSYQAIKDALKKVK